jgi:hypothetical protein
MNSLSEGPAVTYSNLFLAAAITSPDHPAWQWLAKRTGRIVGLSLGLRLQVPGFRATGGPAQLSDWMQPLQTLSGIPGAQLRVKWVDSIASLDHPCIAQWLREHDELISHLSAEVHISKRSLTFEQFSRAAAACSSIDLKLRHLCHEEVHLTDLAAVAGSLRRLDCEPMADTNNGSFRGTNALSNLSQLSALHFAKGNLGSEDPWGSLAKLKSLQQLSLAVSATGDPSPLSALTGLTKLVLQSHISEADEDQIPFSFSSLQPLSTLQQLEVLHLVGHACTATSLQGLAGLSNLKQLVLESYRSSKLVSLEGISSGVVDLSIANAPGLVSLAGIEGCPNLEKLSLERCSASSLQPLGGLSSLEDVVLCDCNMTSLEGLNSMSLQSLSLTLCRFLSELSGVEHMSALKDLELARCGVTSLQPLSQLGEGLQKLEVSWCEGVQEEVLVLPQVQPTADISVMTSTVREVVLAGGLKASLW